MDLLFQRYASPFFFLDNMIRCGRFSDFVVEFIELTNKEKEDALNWEYFLHKVWNKSFREFIEEMKTNEDNKKMTAEHIETTVQNSLNILNNFNPNFQGGEY